MISTDPAFPGDVPGRERHKLCHIISAILIKLHFPLGDVVVAWTVAVVTSGADVGARHSKSLHGHPAEQFFFEKILSYHKIFYVNFTSQGQSSCLVLNRKRQLSLHC